MQRIPDFEIDSQFYKRRSPRGFSKESLDKNELFKLFEAARWSPSGFNEQPWYFIYAANGADKDKFVDLLSDSNKTWAAEAPVILFLLTKKHFSHNGKENILSLFDAGAAWMSFALQATLSGYATHAMGGFDRDRAYEVLGVPRDEYHICIAIALGKQNSDNNLPENLSKLEKSNFRKKVTQFVAEGAFGNIK